MPDRRTTQALMQLRLFNFLPRGTAFPAIHDDTT
jgi:hypothetical protein